MPRSKTIDFKILFTRVQPDDYSAAIFRESVLCPMFPGTDSQNLVGIRRSTTKLIKLRREFFAKLRLLGIVAAENLAGTVNCPPFGAFTLQQGHRCSKTSLCPFCWARIQMRPMVNMLLNYLLEHPDTDLVGSEWSHTLLPGEKLRDRMTREATITNLRYKQIACVRKHHRGTLLQVSAAPEGATWRITRRRLSLVTQGARTLPNDSDPLFFGTEQRRYEDSKPDMAAYALSRVMSFPLWLLSADQATIKTWLEARRGLRLLHKSGKLLSPREEDVACQEDREFAVEF